jgi:REP element-mobilizing transposase RayT
MANTFTQIHLQIIFAVQNRISLIAPSWEEELYRYVTGIVHNNDHKLLAVNGVTDHVHLFIGMRPTQALSSLMQTIKRNSSVWINENGFANGKFSWQEGYGAFSYSRSQLSSVIHYIENQKLHHKKITFIQEYTELLKKFEIDFDERYIFKEVA